MTWRELAIREHRLAQLKRRITFLRDDGSAPAGCANDHWYGRGTEVGRRERDAAGAPAAVPGLRLPPLHARAARAGHEDAPRALGHDLDGRLAEAITITELNALVVIAGIEQREASGAHALTPFQQLLRQDDVATLLDVAFRRRAKATRASALGRLLGR